MLDVADADLRFPLASHQVDLVYAVDVLQHIQVYDRFFEESVRVLRPSGRLVVITDSQEDIRARSLAQLFPTTVPLNLQRYPGVETLRDQADHSGFRFVSQATISGYIDLDDRFMQTLASRALSELRLIPDIEHRDGMARVEALRALGGKWLSQTTVLEWTRS